MAKDKQGSCHRVEPIFHFEKGGGGSRLGSVWESQKPCMDQLCSAREESSTLLQRLQELQRGQQPWAEQQAARGCPVPCRADTAGPGRGSKGRVSFTGEAKSIMQQLLGSDRREGWVDINREPNWQHINGWRLRYRGRKPSEGRRCTHHHLLRLNKQPGPPHHSEGYPSSMSNRNDNSGLNSEPQMPPSLMVYLHITESQGFIRYCLEEGGPWRPSGAPHAHPPGLLKHFPEGVPRLGQLPRTLQSLHLLPPCSLQSRDRGSAPQGLVLCRLQTRTARATQGTSSSCLGPHLQPGPQGQLHWCHFKKVIASVR